jgi:uncharacterized protein YbjT (DUF2867 family)
MKIIIAGASGMVGKLLMENALADANVTEIVNLVRRPSSFHSPKIIELVVTDFSDLSPYEKSFTDIYADFFCIGVYTGTVPKDQFKVITYDYAVEFGRAIAQKSSNVKMCLLSGQGADRKEKSRLAFAKYKGMAENALSKMTKEFYAFRPGYIYPVTPRDEPNFTYKLTRYAYPLLKLFGKNTSIKSTELARVIYAVGIKGDDKEVWENKDMITYLHQLKD